jgi:DNA-binding transcriptional regulator YiaG
MTAALVDDVVRGSWLRASETPASRERSSEWIANLARWADAVVVDREGSDVVSSGAEEAAFRVLYRVNPSIHDWSQSLTSHTPWPVTVYFTTTDAGVSQGTSEAITTATTMTPASVWNTDFSGRLQRVMRRRLLRELTFAWTAADPISQLEIGHDDPETLAEGTDAARIINGLRQTLPLTIDDIAASTGISRRTLFLWQSGRVTPRPATMRPLWRLFALVKAVVEIIGVEGARSWLNAGEPSPFERLLAGRIDLVEDDANRIIFRQSSLRPPRSAGARPEADDDEVVAVSRGVKARTSDRKPQRLRLGESNVRRRD